MKFIPVILLVALLATACSKEEEAAKPEPATNDYSSGNPITAPVDYLGAVSKGQQKAIGTIDLASITSAINLFNVSESRFPKSLQEMVDTGYLGKIPAAPYGKQLSYDPKTGVVTLVPTKP